MAKSAFDFDLDGGASFDIAALDSVSFLPPHGKDTAQELVLVSSMPVSSLLFVFPLSLSFFLDFEDFEDMEFFPFSPPPHNHPKADFFFSSSFFLPLLAAELVADDEESFFAELFDNVLFPQKA